MQLRVLISYPADLKTSTCRSLILLFILLQVPLTPLINILLTTVVNCVFWTNCLSDSNKKVLESWFSLRWQECWTSWKITVCGKDLSTAAWTDRHLMRRDRHQSMLTTCQAVRSLCLCWVPEQVVSESILPQQTLLFCMTATGIHKLISKPWYVYYCKPFSGKKSCLWWISPSKIGSSAADFVLKFLEAKPMISQQITLQVVMWSVHRPTTLSWNR